MTVPRLLRAGAAVLALALLLAPEHAATEEKNTPDKAQSPERRLAPPSGRRLDRQELEEAFAKVKSLQNNMTSASARMRQTKKNPLLKKPLVSEGAVWLKKPNLLRMEVERPEKTLTVVDGKVLWIYRPAAKEALKYVLSEQLMASQAVKFFSQSMDVSLAELEKKFIVSMFEDAGGYTLDLTPAGGLSAKFLAAVRVYFKAGEPLPFKHEIIGKKGNLTVTEFSGIVLNPLIAPDAFTFTLPPDARITNTFDEEPPR